MGATEGLWQGLLLSVSQRLHSLLGPVAVTKEGGDSSVLNLFCAKDQANENCEHRSGIWQIFRQFMKWIPQHIFSMAFFLPSFSSSLPGLEPGQNPWCLALGSNEAQALMSYQSKNSVRDAVIGKRWICFDSERSTLHRVWAITAG